MLPPIIPIHSRSCPSCIGKWKSTVFDGPACPCDVGEHANTVQAAPEVRIEPGSLMLYTAVYSKSSPSVYWSGLYQMHLTVMSHLFHAANNVTVLFPISHRKLNPKDPRFQASCASRTRLDEFFLQAHKAVSKRISNSLPILYTEVIDGGCGLMGPVSILCL